MCDCLGYGSGWSYNAGELAIRANRDPCSLRSVLIVTDTARTYLYRPTSGQKQQSLWWTWNTFEWKHNEHVIELEVNWFLIPSLYLFIDGEEVQTHRPRLTFWLRRFLFMLLTAVVLLALSVGFLVPLNTVWRDETRLRGLYWFLALLGVLGVYFLLASTVGLIRYVCCFKPRQFEKKKAAAPSTASV